MKYFVIIALLSLLTLSNESMGQKSFTATEFSLLVATKMKDSLSLNDIQYEKLIEINTMLQKKTIQIHAENKQAGSKGIQQKLIELEKERESLYTEILTKEQFEQYKIKKANLFNRN